MKRYTSEFLSVLDARGLIENGTDFEALDDLLGKETVTGYIGFDCTAPSLHAGSLVQILMLRWLQQTGHRPIVLLGGGTTRIGDPSGRDKTRQLLDQGTIANNRAGIRKVFDALLTFGTGPGDAVLADNSEWLESLSLIDFLRDYGRHFSVGRMLSFDHVRSRLDQQAHLSFLEFNYMVLQAYDFLELSRRFGCRMQMGGSDQWGNIVNGVDLARRVADLTVFGLTSPLLTTAGGAKMGKTAEGAVWLNADLCSPYQFWQYWRDTADADVGKFLRLFTDLPIAEVERLAALGGTEINEAKKTLANEVTGLVHGTEAAEAAQRTALGAFEGGNIAEGLPTLALTHQQIEEGITLAQLFVKVGLAASGKEAKRLFRDGGARVSGEPVSDPNLLLTADDLSNHPLQLSAGRKRHALVRLE